MKNLKLITFLALAFLFTFSYTFGSSRPSDIVNSVITDKDTGITLALESNGGAAVNIQDQHTRALDLKFIKASGIISLTSDTVINSNVISVDNATGVSVGMVIGIVNPDGSFYFGEAVLVDTPAVGNITLDAPLDQVFDYTTSNVIVASSEINVDGSVTPQVFQIAGVGVSTGIDIDITRINGHIYDSTAMDDGKFGGGAALTYGCVLRIKHNGTYTNLWTVKTNGDLAQLSGVDGPYKDKAPAGANSFRFRITYAGPSKHGVTIRLEPGDTLEWVVQDNLTIQASRSIGVLIQGHFVGN